MKAINIIALILVVIGAINWGLWGFFQFDLVAWLFNGPATTASRVVYSLIGLAGLWSLSFFRYCCSCCHSDVPSDVHSDSDVPPGGCCRK